MLARALLIAEPWDIGPGGYQLGQFPPGWLEWNDRYRDTQRSFWLRHGAGLGDFAHRFTASSTPFRHAGRAPTASVNFITAHDGFTLRDLVSYNERHNLANGEGNRDGSGNNLSWNGGVEGETDDPAVLARRARLQRALLATLLLSQGTPMLLAGDELGHTQQGNNNAYCQDNETTWLDWTGADRGLQRYVARLLALRREAAPLRSAGWWPTDSGPQSTALHWLCPEGSAMAAANWERDDRGALMVLFDGPKADMAWLLLVHAGTDAVDFSPPPGPWLRRLASDDAEAPPRRLGATETVPPATLWLAQRVREDDAGATLP